MSNIEFAWDSRKSRSNLAKHGISFEEAQAVFLDEHARDDPDHSDEEERFMLLGYSFQARRLIVSHCYRESDSDSVIRLISARRATAREEEMYWKPQ